MLIIASLVILNIKCDYIIPNKKELLYRLLYEYNENENEKLKPLIIKAIPVFVIDGIFNIYLENDIDMINNLEENILYELLLSNDKIPKDILNMILKKLDLAYSVYKVVVDGIKNRDTTDISVEKSILIYINSENELC